MIEICHLLSPQIIVEQLGLGQAKPEARKSGWFSRVGGRGTQMLDHHLLPPRLCVSRKLG